MSTGQQTAHPIFGDRVRLRRGGPECLIVDIVNPFSKASYVTIAWEKSGKVKELSLPLKAVEKIRISAG